MRALIVEDNDEDRVAFDRTLNRFGIETDAVSTLREAWLLDPREEFDLIFLDGNLDDAGPALTSFFARMSLTFVVIVTGNESLFTDLNKDKRILVIDKKDFLGRLPEVIEKVSKRLAAK